MPARTCRPTGWLPPRPPGRLSLLLIRLPLPLASPVRLTNTAQLVRPAACRLSARRQAAQPSRLCNREPRCDPRLADRRRSAARAERAKTTTISLLDRSRGKACLQQPFPSDAGNVVGHVGQIAVIGHIVPARQEVRLRTTTTAQASMTSSQCRDTNWPRRANIQCHFPRRGRQKGRESPRRQGLSAASDVGGNDSSDCPNTDTVARNGPESATAAATPGRSHPSDRIDLFQDTVGGSPPAGRAINDRGATTTASEQQMMKEPACGHAASQDTTRPIGRASIPSRPPEPLDGRTSLRTRLRFEPSEQVAGHLDSRVEHLIVIAQLRDCRW